MDMNYAHVWALRWDGFGWIAVTPYVGYTEVLALPFNKKTNFKDIVGKRKWIKVETVADPGRNRIPWILSTAYCVDQIKALLGLRNPFIITPKQLWDYLQREQLQEVKTKSTTTTAGSSAAAGTTPLSAASRGLKAIHIVKTFWSTLTNFHIRRRK